MDLEIKKRILNEYRAVLFTANTRVPKILNKFHKIFYWKGQTGHVPNFVDNYVICQTDKKDRNIYKRQLQNSTPPTNE